jgi:acetylcholinesterase
MMSPLSKGLFHRGISQSGTFLDPWAAVAHPGVAQKRSIRMGEMMGCQINGDNYEEMIECLRKVPAKNVTEAFYDFFVSYFLLLVLGCFLVFVHLLIEMGH